MKLIISIFFVTLLFSNACSNDEQETGELEANIEGEESNQATDVEQAAADEENGSDFNSQGENEGTESEPELNNDQAADVNSDTSNDTQIAEETTDTNQPAQANPTTNVATEVGNASAQVDGSANLGQTASAPSPASTNSTASTPEPLSSQEGSSSKTPIPGGKVRYVPEGGVQVVNGPNGSPLFTLNQGDHPLTWEEGEWLKLADGMFVQAGILSDSGIPRPFLGSQFQK